MTVTKKTVWANWFNKDLTDDLETVAMRILVTGGLGFIGSHAAEFFANNGHDVVVFDNQSRSKLLGAKPANPNYVRKQLGRHKNIQIINGDIRRYRALAGAVQQVDAILHTAGQVAVTTSISDPRTDFEINALGTFNLLEFARKSDARVIFTSTNKVYGHNVNSIPVLDEGTRYAFRGKKYSHGIAEDFPIDNTSHSPYGCSKLAADTYVQDYAETYGMQTGVFRMSCIYGDRQFGVEDQGWVAWFAIAALLDRVITIYGDGKQVRDVLYISDLVRAFDLFLKSTEKHAVFNIGGGPENTMSLVELLVLLERMTGKAPKIKHSEWRVADQKVYVSNINKVSKALGWSPTVAPEQGLQKLVEWWKRYLQA